MARSQQNTRTPDKSIRGQAGAAANRTITAKKQAGAGTANRKTAGKRMQTKREAMEGPRGRRLSLTPIRKHQSRAEVLATVAADSGVDRPIVERVARSLSTTLTRHLIRNGSGRVEIPYLGAALWRGRRAAQKAREMASPILNGRLVTIPGRRACAVPRLRAHSALRDAVARS